MTDAIQPEIDEEMSLAALIEISQIICTQVGRPRPHEDEKTLRRVDMSVGSWITVMTALTALTFMHHGPEAAAKQMDAALQGGLRS